MAEPHSFVCKTCGLSVSNSLVCVACGSEIDDNSSIIDSKTHSEKFDLPFGIIHAPKIYDEAYILYGIEFAPLVFKK